MEKYFLEGLCPSFFSLLSFEREKERGSRVDKKSPDCVKILIKGGYLRSLINDSA